MERGQSALLLFALLTANVLTAAPLPSTCVRTQSSWSTTREYESKRFGNYLITSDNFNRTPGQITWASSELCWGAITNSTKELGGVGSYPHIVRGWVNSAGDMRALSSPGTADWTRRSGMGISVQSLSKARVHWKFAAPVTPGSRWMALIDVYFHTTPTPDAAEFPPGTDLMIDQSLMDQDIGEQTFYEAVASRSHPFVVTLGGLAYLGYVDQAGENAFHRPGGHTLHLFQAPTAYTRDAALNWGGTSATTDVAAIIRYFMQPNARDSAGQPLHFADGTIVSAPLITPNLFLTAINAGWEVDVGTEFSTSDFWVAVQDEPDGR